MLRGLTGLKQVGVVDQNDLRPSLMCRYYILYVAKTIRAIMYICTCIAIKISIIEIIRIQQIYP